MTLTLNMLINEEYHLELTLVFPPCARNWTVNHESIVARSFEDIRSKTPEFIARPLLKFAERLDPLTIMTLSKCLVGGFVVGSDRGETGGSWNCKIEGFQPDDSLSTAVSVSEGDFTGTARTASTTVCFDTS